MSFLRPITRYPGQQISVKTSTSRFRPEVEDLTLYNRLGGYNSITAIADSLQGRIVKDPHIARYFKGHGESSKRKLRQLQVDRIL